MKWKGRQGSTNVEDRRGSSVGGKTMFGGGIGLVVILIVTLLGGNPSELLSSFQDTGTVSSVPYTETEEEMEAAEFVSVVLADTEEVWTEIFKKEGLTYEKPTLVLFTGSVQSACGTAGASAGPFYCPGDEKLYIDLSFYDELEQQLHAPGDFAMAYVIAHEVGHHVQNQLGTMEKIQSLRSRLSETEYNKYQVRLELQADYYAGVWAHYAQEMNLLEEGDLDEAITAASAVGDDTLQKQARGYVVPETFTHGTSAQRQRWFSKGFQSGTIEDGDTFNAESL
ncbi:KPN_02809 family neutral zinc metallopeptidase [Bacillus massiliglaciei]|uniref:KPN_02809 family neutral zinc metallopeptidase n=1 Tax=Bacillus massiliglaciei TaxID=1816693 RepID=UPI000AA81923|nr:neutral zinc metallopeptidase [Bacillus massiliglaciei]